MGAYPCDTCPLFDDCQDPETDDIEDCNCPKWRAENPTLAALTPPTIRPPEPAPEPDLPPTRIKAKSRRAPPPPQYNRPRPPRIPLEKRALVLPAWNGGKTRQEIADELTICKDSVTRILEEHGVPKGARQRGYGAEMPPALKQQILDLWNEGKDRKTIATEVDVIPTEVSDVLEGFGVPHRSRNRGDGTTSPRTAAAGIIAFTDADRALLREIKAQNEKILRTFQNVFVLGGAV